MYRFLGEDAKPSFFDSMNPLLLMVVIFVLMWFMFIRPQRKQEQVRKQMIANIKKNDRILTNGGLYGTVTNVKEQDDEITVCIDDARGVKVRVSRNMIASVVPKGDTEKAD